MKFTCGHEQEDPKNMGRGQSRATRLSKYFDRKCLTCRLEADRASQELLTVPRTAEQQSRIIAKIKAEYWD